MVLDSILSSHLSAHSSPRSAPPKSSRTAQYLLPKAHAWKSFSLVEGLATSSSGRRIKTMQWTASLKTTLLPSPALNLTHQGFVIKFLLLFVLNTDGSATRYSRGDSQTWQLTGKLVFNNKSPIIDRASRARYVVSVDGGMFSRTLKEKRTTGLFFRVFPGVWNILRGTCRGVYPHADQRCQDCDRKATNRYELLSLWNVHRAEIIYKVSSIQR